MEEAIENNGPLSTMQLRKTDGSGDRNCQWEVNAPSYFVFAQFFDKCGSS